MQWERFDTHDPLNPRKGDGSCWITPDGYIPLNYEGHYNAICDEPSISGVYSRAYEEGWIRVGARRYKVEVVLSGKDANLKALDYLHRIIMPLSRGWDEFELEDRSEDFSWLKKLHEVRSYLQSLKEKISLREAA